MAVTVLVVNPHSAGGKTERRWPELRATIQEAYGTFEERFTRSAGDATTITREALKAGADLVVAVGGDGTINEVVNGFFDDDGPIRPQASFGIVPAGTGGDFIKTLGVPRDTFAAAAVLKSAPRKVDVGRLRYVDGAGKPAVRHFINIASFGISGLVDRYVNESSKVLGGKVSFALATLKAGAAYQNASVRLTLDGGTPREGKIYNVAVANGRYFGGGMKVAPDAALDDGLFDVVTMGDFSFGDLLFRGLDIYSGKHLRNPKVSVQRARRIDAEALDGVEVLLDVDGEAPGRLPASFEILQGALQVRAKA
ncbi:MAG: diacylglycerol kinase catalytic region [Myxococcales bacterium]|nr:diacylglycerol kinase catalytic region [Myxococcales bacterium]